MTQISFINSEGKHLHLATDPARGEDVMTAVLYEVVDGVYKVREVYEGDAAREAVKLAEKGKL